MKGKSFLMLNDEGQFIGSGRIEKEVAPGRWLCRINGKVPLGQIFAVDFFMSNTLLFDNPKHLSDWMAANAPAEQQPPGDAKPPVNQDVDFGGETPDESTPPETPTPPRPLVPLSEARASPASEETNSGEE